MVDNAFFLFSSLLLIVYFFNNRHLAKREKLVYSFLFIIFNSSYNSNFVDVQNYNLVIFRTFIWQYTFIWKFTFLDIILCCYLIFNLKNIPKTMQRSKILAVLILGDCIVFAIGILGYAVSGAYYIDGGAHLILTVKSAVYAFSIFLMIFQNIHHRVDIIKPFFIVILLGFLSMICTPASIPLKIRYGISSLISDQDDLNSILPFMAILGIVCLFENLTNASKKVMRKAVTLNCLGKGCVFAFALLILALSISKSAMIFCVLSIIIYFLVYFRKTYKIAVFFCLGCIAVVLLNINWLIEVYTSQAVITRLYQLYDCIEYMSTKTQILYFIGVGPGGGYYSTRFTGDTGEIKLVDIDKYGLNWKFDLQTPILSVFKTAGLLGIVVFLISRIKIAQLLIKSLKKFTTGAYKQVDSKINSEMIAIAVYFIPAIFTQFYFHTTEIPIIVFGIFLLHRYYLDMKIKKEQLRKIEKAI